MIYKIVKTTTDNKSVAEKIIKEVISNAFSPCAQVIDADGCESSYLWKGKLETEK